MTISSYRHGSIHGQDLQGCYRKVIFQELQSTSSVESDVDMEAVRPLHSIMFRAHHQEKDHDEDAAPNRPPGPCLCLCLCFTGQQELSVRQDRQAVGGMLGGFGVMDVGGWTRDDWASAVSSVHLHMAQCPTSTMLNDKSPAFPST